MVCYIGMDVHREFAQLAVVEDGLVRDEGRIGVTPEALRAWVGGLRGDDEVALEATGDSDALPQRLHVSGNRPGEIAAIIDTRSAVVPGGRPARPAPASTCPSRR